MKKTTLLTLLTMLLFAGSNAWAENSWVKTAPAQLQTGDVVVIADLTTSLAMSNSEKNANGGPLAKPISVNEAKTEIAETVGESFQWVVTIEDGTYKFNVADTENYLYCINNNNGLRIGKSEENVFSLKQDDNGTNFLFNEAQSRYVGTYNSTDWRSYTSINNNIKNTVTVFFKKTSGSSSHTSPTLNWLDITGAPIEQLTVSLDGTVNAKFSTNSDGEVTYESSDETVATIDAEGNVSVVGVGTTVINANVAETETYWAGSLSFTLTVVNDGGGNAEYVWVRTAPEDLESGDVVVIADLTKSLAMSNNNGASAAPTAIAVTFSDDEKTEIADDYVKDIWQWEMEVDNTTPATSFKFKANGTSNYLYCINSNNGVRVGDGDANTFIIKDDFLYNDGQARYVGPYQTQDWRCYTSINNNISGTQIAFFKKVEGSGTTVAKPVITPNGGTFTEPVTVTITAGEDCTIYYTTDGTDPAPTHGVYEGPFTISESCTVKAIAFDVTGATSSIATAEFKFPTTISSIAELCAADKGEVTVQFIGWTVTGVKGSNAYFTDGRNGIQLHESGHGFEVGDQLRGQATFTLSEYNGAPQITGLKATSEGVVVAGKNVVVSPQEKTIGELDNTMQGCVIKLTDLTYDGTVFNDATGVSITPYNTFGITMPTLEKDKTYDASGVFIWFKGTKEIAPRSAEDFVEKESPVVTVNAPVITPNGGTFTEPVTVTITADEGCTVYYTIDGTEPGPDTTTPNGINGIAYTEPFTVSEDCVVKAIAINEDDNLSAVTVAEFTFVSPELTIPSIGRLCAAATAEQKTVIAEINKWYVTGINGNQVFITDGTNGIILYQKNHGFELGDLLNGTAAVDLVIFEKNGFTYPEIMGLSATTEGVTVDKTEGIAPNVIAIADLETQVINQQGNVITLEGVTYTDGKFVDDDDNSITPYNTFKIDNYPDLIEGETYNVTGVAVWFGYWEIAPRSADEFQILSSKTVPESSWNVEELTVNADQSVEAIFTTNSDGEVTYESSDESVATIDESGNISIVGMGVTTITANVAETETYFADSKSFTLTVIKAGYEEATFVYNDADLVNQGAPDTGGELTATRDNVITLFANRAYDKEGNNHIKVYGSNGTSGDSYIQLSAAEGYAISKVVLTATNDGYIKEWKDQFGGEVVIDGATATWEGVLNKVILTNQISSQARITTIKVTYYKLEETGETVTISKAGKATYCGATKAVISKDGEWATAGAIISANGPILVVDTLTSMIPANQGVLIMGTPGEYKVYTHPDLEEYDISYNLLTGVLVDTNAPVGSYVLQEQESVGFFVVVEGKPIVVPAGHAYLDIPGTLVPALYFSEEDYDYVTGISAVDSDELTTDGVIYNVAGQRLGKMQKGVNIVGGKKILK